MLMSRETVEVFQEGLLICELQCPSYWTLKSIVVEMERRLSCADSLVLGLFEGPHVLSSVLLESLTLADVRLILDSKLSKNSFKSSTIGLI